MEGRVAPLLYHTMEIEMLNTFVTFFSQPIGDIIVQSIGIGGFGIFVLGVLYWIYDSVKTNPSGWAIGILLIVAFSVISSNETLTHGAAFIGGVGIYGAASAITGLIALMATPVFWLIIIAMLIASR
jgi:hypothetical protein